MKKEEEERFLSAQADRLAGARRKENRRLAPLEMTGEGEAKSRSLPPRRARDDKWGEKRDFSLRKPTASQERGGKKIVGLLRSK